MSELVAWLTKVLDDDEAEFGEAAEAEAERSRNDGIPDATREQVMEFWLSNGGTFWPRRLADIAAKRAVVALHAPRPYGKWRPEPVPQCSYCADLCHSSSGLGCDEPDAPYPCDTIRLLASAYTDRPGYDESWRP